MSHLKVYQWENETWPEFQKVKLCTSEARRITAKLTRHFKQPYVELVTGSHRGTGRYFRRWYGTSFIRVNRYETTLGIVCHEFAHHLNAWYYRGKHHDRKFKRSLKRVYTWAKRYLPSSENTC